MTIRDLVGARVLDAPPAGCSNMAPVMPLRPAGLTLVLLLTAFSTPRAWALQPVNLSGGRGCYPLGLELEYLEDTEGKWSLSDVLQRSDRFRPTRQRIPNFGLTRSVYWIRLQLSNQTREASRWLLEMDWVIIDLVDLFIPTSEGYKRLQSGNRRPFNVRPTDHAKPTFPLLLRPGESQTYYMRLESGDTILVPLSLWRETAFQDNHAKEQLLLGFYYGAFIILILTNLIGYISMRDRSYLYFVLSLACILMYQLVFTGFAHQYLWPGSSWWADRALHLSGSVAGILAAKFTSSYLELRRQLPRMDRVVHAMMAVFAVMSVLSLTIDTVLFNQLVTVFAILLPVLLVAAVLMTLREGYRPAKFALLAFAPIVVGGVIYALKGIGIVPHNLFTSYTFQIGMIVGLMLFSAGLADRINTMRREKDEAQAEALRLQQQAAENLEQEVARKTVDLQKKTRELSDAYDRLAEYDRLKSRFFANVSHELRTPLTLILTPLERMIGAGTPAALADRLRSMEGNALRLLRLVNQLLDFSRLESGGMTVSFERYDLRSLVGPVVEAFTPFARSKGLKLELRGPETLPHVYVDPTKLDKVLCNLLSNACKFTDPEGVIVVRLAAADSAVTVSVKDNGIGIAEQDQKRVFERFGQVDVSAARRYEGTGIGLALSKELTEIMGGRLELESEPGVGSTFRVILPLGTDHIPGRSLIREAPEAGEALPRRAGRAAAALAAETGRREEGDSGDGDRGQPDDRPLVVVVEDNADMRDLVAEICEDDFRVLTAGDGQRGLELIRAECPALVISDVMMPGFDGNELLRRLRDDPQTAAVPVILLTAKAGPEMRLEGLESGADDYLTKPFESRELLARGRNLVRLQRQDRELRDLAARLQREVVSQAKELERTRELGRFLPPAVVQEIVDEEGAVRVTQKRQQICVFRLELRGFEDLLEILEPEDMVAMLNSYLSEMMQVAFERGATVGRFVRDSIFGFFGAPRGQGTKEDALRCARMARRMWQRAVDVCQRWRGCYVDQTPVPTMVITAGRATVGYFGSSERMDYTAVGGPVEEAADLLPKVPAGELACSQAAWTLLQGELEGTLSREVVLQHRTRPMKLYRLAGPPTEMTPTLYDSRGDINATLPPRPSMLRLEPLEPGQVLAERYEVCRRLGEGGMGTVYLAADLKLGIDVAIKVVRPELQADEVVRQRLYKEVKLARLLSHPNIARIYDLCDWSGYEFITMEYVEGRTLDRRLRVEGGIDIEEGRATLLQLCSGLAVAHAARVVHRDLKPSNIMLDREDRVVILDFGVAKGLASVRTRTDTRSLVGTPSYMAPEQFAGQPVDHRADIYALGVIGFEMFTGKLPFAADTAVALAYKHVHEAPVDPMSLNPDLPARLAAVVSCCLQKSPGDRFGSVKEIVSLLS
jgi:signal transduction histidine kinase/class 3 adenylate cyclase/predicted Ser/Thr protein kinase